MAYQLLVAKIHTEKAIFFFDKLTIYRVLKASYHKQYAAVISLEYSTETACYIPGFRRIKLSKECKLKKRELDTCASPCHNVFKSSLGRVNSQ